MADLQLDTAALRTDAAQQAGDDYVTTMEDIRNTIDSGDAAGTGTSLGTMVSSQLQIIHIRRRSIL